VVVGISSAVELAEERMKIGDEKVLQAFRVAGRIVGHGVGYMLTMFGPSRMVLCVPPVLAEPDSAAAEAFLAGVDCYRDYTHVAFQDRELVIAPMGPYDGAHGAALVGLERCFGIISPTVLAVEETP
jgi:hypothetical protein